MRMNKIITLVSVLICLYLLSSCAATSPREKMLIGTWKGLKATTYVSQTTGVQAAAKTKAADTVNAGKQKGDGKQGTAMSNERKDVKLRRMIETVTQTTLTFNEDRTCVISAPRKNVTGTWKLKKKGTILVVKVEETGEKNTLELVSVKDSIATAIQRTSAGDLMVHYGKQ